LSRGLRRSQARLAHEHVFRGAGFSLHANGLPQPARRGQPSSGFGACEIKTGGELSAMLHSADRFDSDALGRCLEAVLAGIENGSYRGGAFNRLIISRVARARLGTATCPCEPGMQC